MADLLFMRVEGIEGEEPIGQDDDLIRIGSYAHSLSMPVTPVRPSVGKESAQRRSYTQHGLFRVMKGLDKSSPKLFAASAQGVLLPTVVIFLCRQEKNLLTKEFTPTPLLTITMTDVVIANFDYGYSDGWPTESIALQYQSIGWEVDWVNPEDGTNDRLEPVGWNGTTNKSEAVDLPGNMAWTDGGLI